EVREPVVDALMVWHMRMGRMDAHRFGHDLGQRPALPKQFIINPAAALLVAREDAVFELLVEPSGLLTAVCCGCGLRRHGFSLLGRCPDQVRLTLVATR